MSELIQTSDNRATIRWKLLTGVSALALSAYVSSTGAVRAEGSGQPQLWIELGGQAEHIDGTPSIFSPPFFANTPASDLEPMVKAQQPPPYSLGLDGKISFTPENSDWILSGAVRYGRSSAQNHLHVQTTLPAWTFYVFGQAHRHPAYNAIVGDGQTSLNESHAVIDFQAGRDVGLGLFGSRGSSTISAGVRFAQFASAADTTLHARPHYTIGPPVSAFGGIIRDLRYVYRATYSASARTERNTHAVGPSLSWNASLPIAGNASDSELELDWGVNAAVLFGRQRAKVHHQTAGYKFVQTGFNVGSNFVTTQYAHTPPDQNRSRNVTIPNVGGFAGVSFRYADAKVSFGYRADFFFGAMDGGINTRKSEDLGFHGPFATISIGLGG